jgi:HAD superfamily hydrolase (TIGR01509 family)
MDKRLEKAQTVIFDVGKVLIDFNIEYIAKQMLPIRLYKYIKEPFFNEQWLKLDAGEITSKESAKLICNKYNLKDDEYLFENIMDNFCEVCAPLPLSSTIKELRKLGKKIYLLTNYADKAFSCSKKHYTFLQEVDGEIVSARVKKCKPEKEIYKILLDKYNIDPSTAIYIDDNFDNIETSRSLNIDSIWYPIEYNDLS